MAILRQVCSIVEHAHVRGLTHPELTTRAIELDRGEEIRIVGWTTDRSTDAVETDLRALGAIAHELLTLD